VNLLQILRMSVEAIPDGAHSKGLRAVLSHIEVAYRHLARGQEDDLTAFTDAVYRCNQAFEGSIKEAYRVLAGKDPARITTHNIERHLDEKKIFKNRVLAAFTNYRTEWRNPSTHDYMLDFDQEEAFLAIISVSAFSKLLIDQISSEIAFREAKFSAANPEKSVPSGFDKLPFRKQLCFALIMAANEFNDQAKEWKSDHGKEKIMGHLSGFINALIPDAAVELNPKLQKDGRYKPSAIVKKDGDSYVIESGVTTKSEEMIRLLDKTEIYAGIAGATGGILVALSSVSSEEYKIYPFGEELDMLVLAREFEEFGAYEDPFKVPSK